MRVVRVRPTPMPGGALHRRPFAPGRSPGPPRPAACRGCLKIGYQITTDRLQGLVEIAYRTDRRQVLTIIWGGRIDDVSRRLVTDALVAAAHEARPACIHIFAATARDLFRHISHTLAARHRSRARRGCFARQARNAAAIDAIPEAAPVRDDLLAATCVTASGVASLRVYLETCETGAGAVLVRIHGQHVAEEVPVVVYPLEVLVARGHDPGGADSFMHALTPPECTCSTL